MPVYNNGIIEPALYILIRELDAIKDITNIVLIVNEGDNYTDLPSNKIKFAVQKEQSGLGNAIYQAHDFVTEDYFMLLLGDMIYKSSLDISCCQQLINCFKMLNKQVMGLRKIPKAEISINGMVKGKNKKNFYSIDAFIEKPELKYALKNKIKIGTFGNYILSKDAMDFFAKNDFPEYMTKSGLNGTLDGIIIKGKSFDIGVPANYYHTFTNFSK